MRILHTSDWHLGRSFHGVGMLDAQAVFLDHLVEVVRCEQVDAVVVSGDVYDRALPAVDAVQLLDDSLDRLVETGAAVLVTSGNHDSAQRLGFGARRSARAGLHLRTRVEDVAAPVVLHDAHGDVALYGIPYLEPALVADRLGTERSHTGVLSAAMSAVRDDLAGRRGARSVVASHAFVVGGEASESERDIAVGGVAAVPASVFDGVSYGALGHLHGPQLVGDHLRYSGSPLAYAFSERHHRKGSWLVELGRDGVTRVDAVEAPVPRRLAALRGRLDDLLTDPALAEHQGSYCQVTLTDDRRPRDPMERLRTRFPHTVVLSFAPEGGGAGEGGYAARLKGQDDVGLCCSFLEHVRGGEVSDVERALLNGALEDRRIAEGEPAPVVVPRKPERRSRPQPAQGAA